MKRTMVHRTRFWILAIALLIVSLAGCSAQATAVQTNDSAAYSGALDTAYENALDPASQLALGTLRLEGTAEAVTTEQAAELLPLWQALQGNALQSDAERNAAVKRIEVTLTEEQVSAIAAMQLAQQDAQAWMQSQGSAAGAVAPASGQVPTGGVVPDSLPAGMASTQLQNVSSEQGVALRPQASAASSTSGGASQGMLAAVVALLAERGAVTAAPAVELATVEPAAVEVTGTPEPAAQAPAQETTTTAIEVASTPEPVLEQEATPVAGAAPAQETVTYTVQVGDTLAAIAQAYVVTVQAIVAANGIADPNAIDAGQELAIPDPAQVPAQVQTAVAEPVEENSGSAAQTLPGLEQLADTSPAPPFTIEINANYAIQDPLVEASRRYVIIGSVRNDGDETYAVSSILVTFYDADGFRGTFTPAVRDGKVVGGEWHWHAETEAEFAALLLAPGEEWPFRIEITAQDMASFLIHPDAAPTGRESAQVALSDVQLVDDGTGYLRISGKATNTNPFKVKDVTVSGVLLDAGGQMASVGSTYLLQEDIEPGAAVHFEVRVAKEAYASYQLYAQAERDWQ